jgi:hypothetical protein
LPDTSAFAASARGGTEFRPWSLQNSLLAANANLLYAANQQRAGKRSIKTLIPPPKKRAKPRMISIADVDKLREQFKT